MGVRGLWSHIRNNGYNFREIKLQNSYIVFDGYNIVNKLYLDSPIFTQYNGEYLVYDIVIQIFLDNLRKCNLEPIFVFDGIHEVDPSARTVLCYKSELLLFYCLNMGMLI